MFFSHYLSLWEKNAVKTRVNFFLMYNYMLDIREKRHEMNFDRLLDEAYDASFEKYIQNIFDDAESAHYQYLNKVYDSISFPIMKDIVKCFLSPDSRKSKIFGQFYWITINPKPDIKFEDFKSKVENFCNHKCVRKCKYTFEQRGRTIDEVGQGFHVHLIADKIPTIRPAEIKRSLKSTFKHMVGNDERHIRVQLFPNSFLPDKIEYLKGNKHDPMKGDMLAMDKIFREKNALENIYTI